MTKFFVSNGLFTSADDNLRVGEGVFETMRSEQINVLLKDFHFERLFNSLHLIGINKPGNITQWSIVTLIEELLFRNNHTGSARVRLTVFKEDNTSQLNQFNYIIESWPLPSMQLNDEGLSIGIYPESKKQCDTLSNLKTNSRELYLQAGKFAELNMLDDCIILNNHNRLCDTTIANIFLIKENIIYTPSLKEGCIAGVMRRNIMLKMIDSYTVIEKEISIDDMKEAEEVFLTNAVKGIRWVKSFQEKRYTNKITKQLYTLVFPG